MLDREEGRRISRLVGGVLLLLVGALLVLRNYGAVPGLSLGDYWPMLLVWVGATRLLGPNRAEHLFSGALIVAMGVFFQVDRIGWVPAGADELWPVFMIAAGLVLILEAARAKRLVSRPDPPSASEPGGRS